MTHDEAEQAHRDDLADAIRDSPKRPKLSTIDQIREIVKTKQFARVNGLVVDGFTASAVVQVYDALSEKNRANFAARPVREMVDITWKLVKKLGKGR